MPAEAARHAAACCTRWHRRRDTQRWGGGFAKTHQDHLDRAVLGRAAPTKTACCRRATPSHPSASMPYVKPSSSQAWRRPRASRRCPSLRWTAPQLPPPCGRRCISCTRPPTSPDWRACAAACRCDALRPLHWLACLAPAATPRPPPRLCAGRRGHGGRKHLHHARHLQRQLPGSCRRPGAAGRRAGAARRHLRLLPGQAARAPRAGAAAHGLRVPEHHQRGGGSGAAAPGHQQGAARASRPWLRGPRALQHACSWHGCARAASTPGLRPSFLRLLQVAVIDFDVHHGNGTEDIFYGRSDLLYVSTHQAGLWPYTGKRERERETCGSQGCRHRRPTPCSHSPTPAAPQPSVAGCSRRRPCDRTMHGMAPDPPRLPPGLQARPTRRAAGRARATPSTCPCRAAAGKLPCTWPGTWWWRRQCGASSRT